MFAGYLFEEREVASNTDIELGLRVEDSGSRASRSRTSGQPQLRPGQRLDRVISHPGPITIGVTGSASQRAPSQVELFARGPHEATSTFEVGNPLFNEETSYTGEVRVAGSFDRFRFEATGFATYYDNYIYGLLTGVTVDEDGTPDPNGDSSSSSTRTATRSSRARS